MVIETKTIPAYFVIPKSLYANNKVTVPTAMVSEEIISEGNLDPEKYYQIISLEPSFPNNKGYVVGDRFTGIGADITGKGTVSEVIGAYPLKTVNFDSSHILGTTATGKGIVNMRLSKPWIKRVKKLAQDELLDEDALMLIAKFQNAYIGRKPQDVFDRFPELDGTVIIDEIEYPKLTPHTWSFEA